MEPYCLEILVQGGSERQYKTLAYYVMGTITSVKCFVGTITSVKSFVVQAPVVMVDKRLCNRNNFPCVPPRTLTIKHFMDVINSKP